MQSVLYRRKQTLFVSHTWTRNEASKKTDAGMDEPESKSVVRRISENQLAIRSSKKIANVTAAYGAYLQTRPDYTVSRRTVSAKYNPSGKVVVREHQQTTISKTRSDRGRNFTATDGSSKARMAMGRKIVYAGRLVPILGYGYVMHNTLTGTDTGLSRDEDLATRTVQGATILSTVQVAQYAMTERSMVGVMTGGMHSPSSILGVFR